MPVPMPFAPPMHKAVVGGVAQRPDASVPASEPRDDDEVPSSDATHASSHRDPIPQPSNPVNPFGQHQSKRAPAPTSTSTPPATRAPAREAERPDTKPAATSSGGDAD